MVIVSPEPSAGLTHWQHPNFYAYFPTACTFEGVLGDLYATSATNPGFNVRCQALITEIAPELKHPWQWACSPACTELEAIVMD